MSVSALEGPVLGTVLQNSQGTVLYLPKLWLRVCRCGDSELWAGFVSQEHTLQGDILRCGLQPLHVGENILSSQGAAGFAPKRAEAQKAARAAASPHKRGKQPPSPSLSS